MQASKIDKKIRMKSLLGAPVCVWWCMMMVFIMPSTLAIIEVDECGQQLDYNTNAIPTIPYDVRLGERCYSKFLTRLRNLVQASPRACGLPSTRRVPSPGTEYVQVDLKFSNTQWVTLGIDSKDLYIWGYQDKFNGTYRAIFLKDAPLDAKNSLFRGSTSRTTIYEGNYKDLQNFGRKNKLDQTLGIPNLEASLKELYGKPEGEVTVQTEARFFLMVVQMVSEAARFKFIETAIYEYNNKPEIKLKLAGFVNDWDKISYAIHKAENQTMNKCTVIRPPIEVGNIDYKLMVNNVDDVKSDMALLKYMPITTSKLVDNVDRTISKPAVI